MNQRGFITLPLAAWGAIAAGAVIVGLGVAVKVQSARLETSKTETVAVRGQFDAFVAQAKALGEQQAEKAKAQDILNKQFKESADAKLTKAKTDLAAMYAEYRRVRNASARASTDRSAVPEAPIVTSSTPRTCFDTAKFAGAMGILEAGVPAITEQGDVARLRLSTAVEWAASLTR